MADFWRSAPPPGTPLNRQASITAGMIFALAPWTGAGRTVPNLVTPTEAGVVVANAPAWVRNDRGVFARVAGGSGEYIGVPAGILRRLLTGSAHRSTLELTFWIAATGGFITVIDWGAGGGGGDDRRYSIFLNGTTQIYLVNSGGDWFPTVTGIAWAANQRMTLHVTNNGGAAAVYLNGVRGATGSWTFGVAASDQELRLGTNPSVRGGTTTVDYEQLIWWDRVLTHDEIRERVANPWGHLHTPFWRRIWVVQPPAGIVLINPSEGESEASPITFIWRGYPHPSTPANLPVHYQLAVAADGATLDTETGFVSPLVNKYSRVDSGFEFDTSAGDDGSGPWNAIPAGGLTAANQGRQVRFSSAVTAGARDWRVRQIALQT